MRYAPFANPSSRPAEDQMLSCVSATLVQIVLAQSKPPGPFRARKKALVVVELHRDVAKDRMPEPNGVENVV